MSYDHLFTAANMLALIGWLILVIFPFSPFTNKVVVGVVVAILCATYAVIVYRSLQPVDIEKFKTLQGIISLLSTPGAALAGWLHYLAFDLMSGVFIVNNAALHGIKYLWILPCLILTFLLGPIGLLFYLVIRWALTKYYFADNF